MAAILPAGEAQGARPFRCWLAWYYDRAVVEFVLVARLASDTVAIVQAECVAATKRGRARRVHGLLLLQLISIFKTDDGGPGFIGRYAKGILDCS